MRWLMMMLVLLSGALLADLPSAAGRCAVVSGGLLLCDDREEALVRREGPTHGSLFDRDGRRLGWFRVQRDGTVELFNGKSERLGTVTPTRGR